MARQKLKNHSGASKRLRKTGRGKWIRRKAGLRHILTSKTPQQKSRLGKSVEVDAVDQTAIQRLLPYK